MSDKRVYLFDSTLRDGAQTQGVDFTVADKAIIARALDKLGIDYVEGGWPGANPTDDAFFAAPPKVDMDNERHMAVAEGNGPVHALDNALRKVLTPGAGTGAVTRVMIESADGTNGSWTTVGVSTNVIDASYNALNDGITYKLFRDGARAV